MAADTDDASPAPRLSAFILLIGGLLAVFALVDRLDRIVATVSEAGRAAEAFSIPVDGETTRQRVVAIIGGDSEDRSAPPGRDDAASGETSERARDHAGDDADRPAETDREPDRRNRADRDALSREDGAAGPDLPAGGRDSDAPGDAPEAEDSDSAPILPRRPGKGTRLSGGELARRDRAPASTADEAPDDAPAGPQRYRAAPHADAPVASAAGRTNAAKRAGRDGYTLHTLRKNETLWSIAARVYGDGRKYKAILRANPGLRADALTPGEAIRLPRPDRIEDARNFAARDRD